MAAVLEPGLAMKQYWNSFLPAFPSHLILARSNLTSPRLRAKIISTDPDLAFIVVQCIDRDNS